MSYILPPHGSLCYLKKIVNAQAPDTNFKTVTLLLCDDDPDIAAEDIPLKRWSWDPNEGEMPLLLLLLLGAIHSVCFAFMD